MSQALQREDGVSGAVDTFYRQFYVDQTWRNVPEMVAAELRAKEKEVEEGQKQKQKETRHRKQGPQLDMPRETRREKKDTTASNLKMKSDAALERERRGSLAAGRAEARSSALREARDAAKRASEAKKAREKRNSSRARTVASARGDAKQGEGHVRTGIVGGDGEDDGDGSVQSALSGMLSSLDSLPSLELPDMPSSSDMMPDMSRLSFFSAAATAAAAADDDDGEGPRPKEAAGRQQPSSRGSIPTLSSNKKKPSRGASLRAKRGGGRVTAVKTAELPDAEDSDGGILLGGPLEWLISAQEERPSSISILRGAV